MTESLLEFGAVIVLPEHVEVDQAGLSAAIASCCRKLEQVCCHMGRDPEDADIKVGAEKLGFHTQLRIVLPKDFAGVKIERLLKELNISLSANLEQCVSKVEILSGEVFTVWTPTGPRGSWVGKVSPTPEGWAAV